MIACEGPVTHSCAVRPPQGSLGRVPVPQNDTLPDTYVLGRWRKRVDVSVVFRVGVNTMMDF